MKKHKFKTSAEAAAVQEYLTAKVDMLITHYSFDEAIETLKEIKVIDVKRRKLWHKEKFGPYDKIAREAINLHKESVQEFASDDIPF